MPAVIASFRFGALSSRSLHNSRLQHHSNAKRLGKLGTNMLSHLLSRSRLEHDQKGQGGSNIAEKMHHSVVWCTTACKMIPKNVVQDHESSGARSVLAAAHIRSFCLILSLSASKKSQCQRDELQLTTSTHVTADYHRGNPSVMVLKNNISPPSTTSAPCHIPRPSYASIMSLPCLLAQHTCHLFAYFLSYLLNFFPVAQ